MIWRLIHLLKSLYYIPVPWKLFGYIFLPKQIQLNCLSFLQASRRFPVVIESVDVLPVQVKHCATGSLLHLLST